MSIDETKKAEKTEKSGKAGKAGKENTEKQPNKQNKMDAKPTAKPTAKQTKAKQTKMEQAKTEHPKTKQASVEQSKTEQTKMEQAKQAKTEHPKTKQASVEQSKAKQPKTKQASVEKKRAEQPKAEQPRLRNKYEQNIKPKLLEKFKYNNVYQVPKLQKIVVNMGVAEAVNDSKKIKAAEQELTIITGQKAVTTKAKKAIAGFKIRKNMKIGAKVTLRKRKMYEFLDRLVNIALPRVQDFRGFNNKSCDGNGNFNLGIKEQIVFPEIEYDKIEQIRGMNIAICTNAKTDKEAIEMLTMFGIPFVKKNL